MNPVDCVVTGATGNIGRKLTELLLSKGKKVRAVARDAGKLQALAQKGAEPFPASLDDAAGLTRAFAGARSVFAMIPPKYDAPDFRAYQNKIGEALAQAIRSSNIPYVVNLSSLGAHRPDGLGPINGLYDQELRLNQLTDVNIVHLRPTYFMENQYGSLGLIKHQGINGSAIRGDVAIPMIATQDIARVAAEYLLNLSFKGHTVRELLGPKDVSLQEVTAILGKAIGKPNLQYVQFPYVDAEKAIAGMGFSKDVARLFVEMARGFNEGLSRPTQGRTPQTTTPTRFEEFAPALAQAYRQS
jgi:uncharacterized protein YbjT (DUF2867 family)